MTQEQDSSLMSHCGFVIISKYWTHFSDTHSCKISYKNLYTELESVHM